MTECYSWAENRLVLEDNIGNGFDLKFKKDKTMVRGETATGKTLLCKTVSRYSDKHNPPNLRKYDTDNIFIVDDRNKDEIAKQSSKLIIIDRAESIIDDRLADIINRDTGKNRYLIFSRKPIGISLSPNYYAEFYREGRKVSLKYLFDKEGWN